MAAQRCHEEGKCGARLSGFHPFRKSVQISELFLEVGSSSGRGKNERGSDGRREKDTRVGRRRERAGVDRRFT